MLEPQPRNVGTMMTQQQFPCALPILSPQTRVDYSTLNSSIVLTFYWNGDNEVFLGSGDNPQTYPYKIGSLPNATAGDTYTVELDLSKVPSSVLVPGANLTIQAVCHQPTFDIYQCADVIYDIGETQTTAVTAINPTATVTSTIDFYDSVQYLAEVFEMHIADANGCLLNSDMPEDSPSRDLAALWVRGAFHDVGKYDPSTPQKPVASLLPFFVDETENAGIGISVATKFASNVEFHYSRADFIALAAQVTVTHCGGPSFDFYGGRTDAPANTTFASLPNALPDDFADSFTTIKQKLYRLGLDDLDIVTLVTGSHSLGGAHGAVSPHITHQTIKPFDTTPGIFDNDIFKQLLAGNCVLNVDCAIAADPTMRPIVQKFAENQTAFFEQYSLSFPKLVTVGQSGLSQFHVDISVHANLTEEGGISNLPGYESSATTTAQTTQTALTTCPSQENHSSSTCTEANDLLSAAVNLNQLSLWIFAPILLCFF
ncbi:L-ascorbate peroxidase 3 [Entophlyctis sp. JEL0112]|nr:L-ascorbate peroxidase 3 [Entophlyctis sp. JEL0112]